MAILLPCKHPLEKAIYYKQSLLLNTFWTPLYNGQYLWYLHFALLSWCLSVSSEASFVSEVFVRPDQTCKEYICWGWFFFKKKITFSFLFITSLAQNTFVEQFVSCPIILIWVCDTLMTFFQTLQKICWGTLIFSYRT